MLNTSRDKEDEVCSAMALPRFVPDANNEAIRLLLRPTFHPEVCVTLTPTDLSVVTLQKPLFSKSVFNRIPEFAERVPIDDAEYHAECKEFESALIESMTPRTRLVIDGMGISAVRVTNGTITRFAADSARQMACAFCASVCSLVIEKTKTAEIRNRVSRCGGYASGDFTVLSEPEFQPPEATHILVLGVSQERDALHRAFGAKVAAAKDKPS